MDYEFLICDNYERVCFKAIIIITRDQKILLVVTVFD
jgi:hypothetical protein